MSVLEVYIGVWKVADSHEEQQTAAAVLASYPVVAMASSVSRRAGSYGKSMRKSRALARR